MRSVIRQAKTVEEAVSEALEILSVDRLAANIEIIEEPKAGILGIFGAKDAVVRVSVKEDIVSEIIDEVFYDKVKEEKVSPDLEDQAEDIQEVQAEDIYFGLADSDDETDEEEAMEAEDLEEEEEVLDPEDQGQEEAEDLEPSQEAEVLPSEDGEKTPKISEENLVSPDLLRKILKGMKIEGDVSYTIDGSNISMKIIDVNQRDTSIIIGKRGDTLDAIQYVLNLAENKESDAYVRINLDISDYRERRKDSLVKLANNMAKKALRQNRNIKLEPMNAYERKIIHSVLQDMEGIETYSEGKEPRRRLVIKIKD